MVSVISSPKTHISSQYQSKLRAALRMISAADCRTWVSSSVNGRKYYCLVTDKYGQTVKTNTVTISMAAAPKITKAPASVKVASGKTAKVTFTASGEGLTYKWYYKDKGQSKFTLTTSFKTNTYSVEMTSARNGRQLYCVVTDKYGQTVKTATVTISMK